MTTPSKRTREQAADVCAMCASYGEAISVARLVGLLWDIDESDARTTIAARLAVLAWDAAARKRIRTTNSGTNAETLRDDYAEAEALLRTGWSPPEKSETP